MRRKLTIWENRKRAQFLIEFRDLVVSYFNERDEASQIRTDINLRKEQAHRYIRESRVPTILKQYPAPMFGGHIKEIDLVANIFQLRPQDIPPRQVVDAIEQAIGVYEDDRIPALKRTFNPFWWLGRGLSAIASIPFTILEHAGLKGRKFEESFLGKIVKLLTEIVALFTAVYTLLRLIGTDLFTLWEKFRP